MKTLIAVPCMDTVDAYFARSLAQIARVGDCIVEFEIGTLVNFARDKLAGTAIGAGCDFKQHSGILSEDRNSLYKLNLFSKNPPQ